MKTKLTIFLALFLFAGSAHAVSGALLPPKSEYEKTLNRYTKNGEYYSVQDLHAHLIWYSTYISDEFQGAFREQYDKVYPHGQEELANKRAEMWKDVGPDATFFVAIYTRKKSLEELGNDKSLLDLSLEVQGRNYKPKQIEKVPITPFEEAFFPYVNLWYRGYRVVFPVEVLSDKKVPFNLQLHGPDSHSELKFK